MVTIAASVLATIALWFGSTALIVWLANRRRQTFALSLMLGGAAGAAGLVMIVAAAPSTSAAAAYASFTGALLVWGWHELAFLTGAVAGPRRIPRSAGAGRSRFGEAAATLIHHEIALAATATLLLALTWNAANQTGAAAFALLFALRLSAKLNIHHGVPNLSHELLPSHLAYLKSYFGPPRLGWPLPVSLVAVAALAAWLGGRALAAPDEAGAALLFTLAALGALEHLFLALPVRDGALWRWAIPARPGPSIRGGGYGL